MTQPSSALPLTAKDLVAVSPFVDGVHVGSAGSETFSVYNPATGALMVEYPAGCPADADLAVTVARKSFEAGVWCNRPALEKKKILFRWADLIQQNAAKLDALDALEMGKPIGLPSFTAAIAADFLRFNAEASDKILGAVLPSDGLSTVLQARGPRGVVAAVVPWNFPTYNCLLKLAPAIAAGNSVVLKPSELAVQSALLVAKLALEAGLPPGVLNVVPGTGAQVGKALAEHMDVDMLTFTGSSRVGKLMLQYSGTSNMKVVMAECGGKSPHIVFADGLDIDRAAGLIAYMILMNQGQVCSVGSRVLVQESIEERLVEKIVEGLGSIVPGDPQNPATRFGPLASARQLEVVQSFVARAHKDGAQLACGGTRILEETGGYYFAPTLFRGVAEESQLMREEVFGPVLSVMPFKDADEAVRLAKATRYGLAAYIWSAKPSVGLGLANRLQTAITLVNTSDISGAGPGFSFSGEPSGLSGVGIEGGLAGLESYTRRQTVWINHG
jgi:acyl-CoA reductase-like NAD-dependent aldehyde dehydrogenase